MYTVYDGEPVWLYTADTQKIYIGDNFPYYPSKNSKIK